MPKEDWPWPRSRPPWPMSLKERLYEVRKRKERRVRIAVHTYLKRKYPLRYYLHRRAPSYHPRFHSRFFTVLPVRFAILV